MIIAIIVPLKIISFFVKDADLRSSDNENMIENGNKN